MKNHKQWVSEVFDRAAPTYGEKSSSFFSYFGKRLVEQVEVKPHYQVLDVATGRGAVLFPLTERIRCDGKIIGIDISKQMIQETDAALKKRGILSVHLMHMDAENLEFPDNSFDLVFCGFALFFFPSLSKALSEFKRVLKPGGSLVVSIWGDDSHLDECINQEINQVAPLPSLAATPLWEGESLKNILAEAHFKNIQIHEENKTFLHHTPEDWWNSLWNHGTRSKLEQLSPEQLESIHKKVMAKAQANTHKQGLEEELQVFYGIAIKGG